LLTAELSLILQQSDRKADEIIHLILLKRKSYSLVEKSRAIMGSGASTLHPEQKVLITKALQQKYDEFHAEQNQIGPESDKVLLQHLAT
jgi:hypothetical protein